MWHFTALDKKLLYHDNRDVVVGETLTVPEPIKMCELGLHASKRLIDALKHAHGPYVWFVKLSGTVIHGDDKSVATERTAVWGFDATEVLRKFSRKVALESIEKYWDEKLLGTFPDVVKKWLTSGDESLRSAAWSAARSAAESAAQSAAWSGAACRAAQSAARSAAWSAAQSAAWSSAQSAAWSSAQSAAWSSAQSAPWISPWSAAQSAAWSSAESAAWSAQDKTLKKLIRAAKIKA